MEIVKFVPQIFAGSLLGMFGLAGVAVVGWKGYSFFKKRPMRIYCQNPECGRDLTGLEVDVFLEENVNGIIYCSSSEFDEKRCSDYQLFGMLREEDLSRNFGDFSHLKYSEVVDKISERKIIHYGPIFLNS